MVFPEPFSENTSGHDTNSQLRAREEEEQQQPATKMRFRAKMTNHQHVTTLSCKLGEKRAQGRKRRGLLEEGQEHEDEGLKEERWWKER